MKCTPLKRPNDPLKPTYPLTQEQLRKVQEEMKRGAKEMEYVTQRGGLYYRDEEDAPLLRRVMMARGHETEEAIDQAIAANNSLLKAARNEETPKNPRVNASDDGYFNPKTGGFQCTFC